MMERQVLRWLAVGLSLNAALYCAYLMLTILQMSSSAAMTLTYASGVLLGFVLNRRITFRYKGDDGAALIRYCFAYAAGYCLNLGALKLFSGELGVPHEFVQAATMAFLAIMLFLLQRHWVFRTRGTRPIRPTIARSAR